MTGTVDQNLDSKTHENIKAISDAITGVIGATTKGSDNRPYAPTPSVTKEFVVRCTNVPLGYYEAVIANHCGRKRLCGWRYVGFAPFMACTTSLPNETALDSDLYGLVFKNGVMVFEPLNCIAGPADTGRCAVPATEVPAVYEIQNCQDCNCDCKDDLPAQQLEPLQVQPVAPADGELPFRCKRIRRRRVANLPGDSPAHNPVTCRFQTGTSDKNKPQAVASNFDA